MFLYFCVFAVQLMTRVVDLASIRKEGLDAEELECFRMLGVPVPPSPPVGVVAPLPVKKTRKNSDDSDMAGESSPDDTGGGAGTGVEADAVGSADAGANACTGAAASADEGMTAEAAGVASGGLAPGSDATAVGKPETSASGVDSQSGDHATPSHTVVPHPSIVDVLWDVGPIPDPWEVLLESLLGMTGKTVAPMRRRIQLGMKFMCGDVDDLRSALKLVPCHVVLCHTSVDPVCGAGLLLVVDNGSVAVVVVTQTVSDDVYCSTMSSEMREYALRALDDFRRRREIEWGRGYCAGEVTLSRPFCVLGLVITSGIIAAASLCLCRWRVSGDDSVAEGAHHHR